VKGVPSENQVDDNASVGSIAHESLSWNNGTSEPDVSESEPLLRYYGDDVDKMDRLDDNHRGWKLTFTENLTPAHFQT